MEKILAYLEQLDLSEIEAKLYLTLLETGPTSVRDIANAIGIKRTTAYLYVEQLADKGLITKMVHSSRPQIAANPPESSLENLVHAKVEKTKVIQHQFPTMLTTIQTSFPTGKAIGEVEIRYYKGRSGAKIIYEEALQAKELRSYVNISIMAEIFPENTELFSEAFKKNRDIKTFEIFEDSAIAKKQVSEFQTINPLPENYHYKFLPEGVRLSASDILIYEGKVAIINASNQNQITGVILKDNDYYKNSKELFDVLWRLLPEISS